MSDEQPAKATTRDVWKYRILRQLGRMTVESAALATMHRMPPMVTAAAIVRRGNTVLTIRDTAQGMPVLPGGHLHWLESVEEGLQREVREETGYEVEPTRLLETLSSRSGLSERGIIRVIWEAKIVGGTECSSPEGKVEWLAIDSEDLRRARDGAIVHRWVSDTTENPAARETPF